MTDRDHEHEHGMMVVELDDPATADPDEEWANALTHGLAAIAALLLGVYLILQASDRSLGLVIACAAYLASAFGTFLFSTLSHLFREQPLLDRMRAWDQAMIYTMISGTYTPIAWAYASDAVRPWLLTAIWVAAAFGVYHKIFLRHRINSIGTISYLLLGWLPSIPLAPRVPADLAWWMVAGGVLYTVGVVLLINDARLRYLHAGWHLSVMTAALCHYLGILHHVVMVS